MAGDSRYEALIAVGVGPDRAVQIVRAHDRRVFSMSTGEARILSAKLIKAAEQAEARRQHNDKSS